MFLKKKLLQNNRVDVKVMCEQLTIIGIIIMLVCVGLSGCNQQSVPSVQHPVEFFNVTVTTKWNHDQADGFYHGIPKTESATYEITGNVKNNISQPILHVTVDIRFLDVSGYEVDALRTDVYHINTSESKPFTFSLDSVRSKHFFYISNYSLEYSNVQLE